ncbi:MAG: 50S ribosomal protein L30 [Candidatus Heimdallarchaeota archaeon]|nr:MAG: 50S ribosomal protein L30 [Candidatus Heimdallarchaeota archaeon]
MAKNVQENSKRLAVIRIRGQVDRSLSIKRTLELLRLNRTNHCVIIDDRETYKGMLQKAKDLIAWGELDSPTMKELLLKRGRLDGGKRITEDYIQSHTDFSNLDDFVDKFIKFEASLSDIKGLKPVFRLHPPRKGHKRHGIKQPFSLGGALGYRGNEINDLILKMA